MVHPSSGKLEVDWAGATDNESILKLSHRCPMEGMLTLYPDRSPVFNRLLHQLDSKAYHAIVRADGEAVGLLGILHEKLYLNQRPYPTAYFMDFKVAPEYRSGLTAYRLAKAAIEREVADRCRMGMATLLKGNDAVHVFTRGRGGFPGSVNLGMNRVYNFIPLFRLHINKKYPVEIPSEEDIPEMADLLNRFYNTYKLAPRITEEQLRFYVREIDGLSLNRFRIVRRDGRISAVVASWVEHAYKRFVVTRRNPPILLVNMILRLLGLVFRMPAPVRRGKPLRQKTLVLWAHDDCPEALATLIRDANNQIRGKDFTLLQFFVHEEDPIIPFLKGMIKIKVLSEIQLFTDTEELAAEVRRAPGAVHLEFPMFI